MTGHDAWLTLLFGFGVMVALGSTSGLVNERLWVSEPLACAIAGIAIGPAGLDLVRLDPGSNPLAAHILREAARVTLVIAVSGAAMRLPAGWMRVNWGGLSVALGPGMLLMWGASALVTWGALGLAWLPCLLGAALCDAVNLHLATGVTLRGGIPALVRPSIDYDGLVDAMFHLIRQNAAGSAAILIHMLDVLIAVAGSERDPARLAVLQRHADLIHGDAEKTVRNTNDFKDLCQRSRRFVLVRQQGALAGVAK